MNDKQIIEKALRKEDTYRDIQEHIVVGHLQDFNKLLYKLISNVLTLKEQEILNIIEERIKYHKERLNEVKKRKLPKFEMFWNTQYLYERIVELEELKQRIKGEGKCKRT
jgi:hypothetical protein